MEQAKYIGKIEENPFGVPLDYQYADSHKMNQFVLYLMHNQEELASRFVKEVSDEFASSFISIMNNLDEFEVLRYLNLELFDVSSSDLVRLELTLYMAGIQWRLAASMIRTTRPSLRMRATMRIVSPIMPEKLG